ncbi:glyoxalase superfamily protein [Paenibacillus alba]|uniref:Bleomycin resistance protein n=1 Tax=Paenibacillus alba TaxID=1197127 RepID=A0ABU6FWK4_9BACL|nr:glyoxalase superfamily protein [Paenibacillus alba]MEC0226125.1 glyoxalase superfamily protein [Paenibacillus alba]
MASTEIQFKSLTPILRIFDVKKAKEFYLDYLEFTLDWQHGDEDSPIYMQVSKGDCILHLSEHHGDCCPGAALNIEVQGIEALHAKLQAKNYKYFRPGLETTPWNTREISVIDGFGNKLNMFERLT